MSMITKCPTCGTAFRVSPPQLQAQRGLVRCGQCATIFDGFKTLTTQPDIPQQPTPVPDASTGIETRREVPVPATPTAREGVQVDILPDVPALPAMVEVPPDVSPVPPPVAVASPELVTPPPQATADLAEPAPAYSAFAFDTEIAPRRRTGGWAFGVLLLLIALAAQGAYYYRGELAANFPESRPYLNKACLYLRCAIALPQRPRAITIEASDMQATDPASPGMIALTATLRNHAAIALGYPALDVVLTNAQEHTVARRIFLPAEYLDAGAKMTDGIQPNGEITIRLDIDTGDLGAAGFRLDLLPAS